MRIGLLSDIHVDINYYDGKTDMITPAVCEAVINNGVDVFISAGDIASDHSISLDVVDRIEKTTGRDCLFIPGNHDLWNENHPGMTADQTYRKLLKHPHNLASGPVSLKPGWSAAGDTCWYDYSFGTHELFSMDDLEKRTHNGRVWQDSIMAVWNRSDQATHDWFLNRLRDSFEKSASDEIIAVTHMLPIREFTVPVPNDTWDYFNAFLGSVALGDTLIRNGNVRYSVSGHVHYRKTVEKNGIVFICQCLGYRTEWRDNDDPFEEVEKSIKIIEI